MSKNRRLTISAVLIVKNEEDVLATCLDSVRWADEIVVYDTGSTDATREIARRYTDIVIEGYWDDDFAAARNRALEHATGDWVLSIDADEEFESQGSTLRKRLAYAKHTTYGVRIVNTGSNSVDETDEFTAIRVFRREGKHWVGQLHEQIAGADGLVAASGMLGGIRLRHSGYADQERLTTEKAERNITLSREQLAEAEAAGDAVGAAVARVHLSRSLIMGGPERQEESAAVAEQAWEEPGRITDQLSRTLSLAQYKLALGRGDLDRALLWVERWRSAQPDSAAVDIAAAEVYAQRGEAEAGLAALDRVPTVFRDSAGGEMRRSSAINVEIGLLVSVDRGDEALALVRDSLRTGDGDPWPVVVLVRLGEDAFRGLLGDLSDDQWRRWALLSVRDGSRAALRVLELMEEHRPGDHTVLASGARVAPLHGLEAAADWDARLHRHGLGRLSTLVAFASDRRGAPADRAVAAALAISAYHDERAFPHLENALDRVPTQGRSELAEALGIVAPGLVSLD
ncbi:MAG: glycosyltransferase [Micrococcales bacterium]|nr:glycosyltransferase [Micrococcales bacterium]